MAPDSRPPLLFDLGEPVRSAREDPPRRSELRHDATPEMLFDLVEEQEKIAADIERQVRELLQEKGDEVRRPFVAKRHWAGRR